MAHILLPTDHSENSLNAAVYAVKLFNRASDRFTVVHAFGLPHGTGGNLVNIDKELAEAAEEGMERFLHDLRKALPSEPVMTARCENGPLRAVISRVIKEAGDADLIVMGTQGATGLKRVLVGSNTATILQDSPIPVLAVPEKATFSVVRRIAVADDSGTVDPEVLAILLDIARANEATLDLLHVLPAEGPEVEKSTSLEALLGGVPHTYQQVRGGDVMKALHHAAEENHADLLAVLHRERSLFGQILHKSVASQLAMYTRIPMLVLHQGM
ncbi:MAG: universal stress protein [Flavobacteriales bacterium]|jgi:nucleotide-binding universal stress UspA family protein|nr:universal stress protein [Flavobacteriales bacterium]MBK7484274.1 universal stress protein [Flavobacteriales bacterium]MBK7618229.1 universal stress protein [Flavobacteriales bacterium]MBK9626127.1 universal stress protein [Flavobacteriales bacterium]